MWIHRWRKTSGSASTPGPGERTCVKWQNLCHPSVFDPWRWYESVLDCKHVPKPKKELQPIPSSKHRRIIFFSLAVSSESNFYSVLVGFFFGHWLNFLDWQNWPLDFYFTLLSLSLSHHHRWFVLVNWFKQGQEQIGLKWGLTSVEASCYPGWHQARRKAMHLKGLSNWSKSWKVRRNLRNKQEYLDFVLNIVFQWEVCVGLCVFAWSTKAWTDRLAMDCPLVCLVSAVLLWYEKRMLWWKFLWSLNEQGFFFQKLKVIL